MRDFIERLRSKPEHVRQRVALGSAAGITGVVTMVWFLALTVSGNLSLAVPSADANSNATLAQTATPAPDLSGALAQTQTGFNQLLGAAGVATATTAPAALTVEDVKPAKAPVTEQRNSEGQTVIPF
jgi:hypothetical protein